MDDTVLKIAIAAFLHDIGKFAERSKSSYTDNEGFNVSNDFILNNQSLYQPLHSGYYYSHSHAVYTAAFIELLEKLLPEEFNKNKWGLEDSFINLAAGHHKPETPLQWIIAIADRLSSGFDRAQFDDYNKGINVRDYKKTRLLTIFEAISLKGEHSKNSLEQFFYRYPLKELSPVNIYPVNNEEITKIDSEQATKDYQALFNGFKEALENLANKNNLSVWLEHFDSLFTIFASHIPAASVGNVVPDVSLYDHCRTTSAIATALYKYHLETNSIDENSIKDYEIKKFLLVSCDFYGIQDFIFSEAGSTGKNSAKLLRGRSFYISLLTELAADFLCKELGLATTSVILNAAGKFTVLAHNTDDVKKKIKIVEQQINDWLIERFYGQASMGISFIEASGNDFTSEDGKFLVVWEKLLKFVNGKKYKKIDIFKYGGSCKDYLDKFDNKLGVCPFCGKRPAVEACKIKDEHACKMCHDHIFIGENLVKNDQIAILNTNCDVPMKKLLEPIFGKYQLVFLNEGQEANLKKEDLVKHWSIEISKDGRVSKNITAKFINSYVPKYEEEDQYDERYISGKKSDIKKEEMIEQIKECSPKSFSHIAVKALNFTEQQGKFKGVEALGILKADVDLLGAIFSFGISKKMFTLSRLATLSRQMNNFFTIYLPYVLKSTEKFKDIYTIFSGGDDLFLIGPWNKMIDFADIIYKNFKKYVCDHPEITLSVGISIHKPNEPLLRLSEAAEDALVKAKNNGRNSITIFDETVKWNDFTELQSIKNTLEEWYEKKWINNAMLFRINELINMRKRELQILQSNTFYLENLDCMLWRARLKYTIARNIGAKLNKSEREEAIKTVMDNLASWLEKYGGALKIPLWQIIYNNRK